MTALKYVVAILLTIVALMHHAAAGKFPEDSHEWFGRMVLAILTFIGAILSWPSRPTAQVNFTAKGR